MKKYSISDLEQLSGIQSHTIRIWEQRYNALTPMRSAGNTRYYDDHQLRRLLNMVSLIQSGKKVSQVCRLSDHEINELIAKDIAELQGVYHLDEYYISQIIHHGLHYDEAPIQQLLHQRIHEKGLNSVYTNIIYPVLVRIGLMWCKDDLCPAQEHFVSNLIRQKLFSSIDTLPLPDSTAPVWLLFLPADEDHDIGLLFAYYLIKEAGHKVIYLGSRVPYLSLEEAVNDNKPDHLLTFMTRMRPVQQAQEYLTQLTSTFSTLSIHLAGNLRLLEQMVISEEINWIRSADHLIQMLQPQSQKQA